MPSRFRAPAHPRPRLAAVALVASLGAMMLVFAYAARAALGGL